LDLVQIAAKGLSPRTSYQVYLADSNHEPFDQLEPFAARAYPAHAGAAASGRAGAAARQAMMRTTAERLEWVSGLNTKGHFGGVVPKHYHEAIDALEALHKKVTASATRKVS